MGPDRENPRGGARSGLGDGRPWGQACGGRGRGPAEAARRRGRGHRIGRACGVARHVVRGNSPIRLRAYAVGPMALYHLDTTPRLNSPIVVAAFDGWVDGGRAGTLAADQ